MDAAGVSEGIAIGDLKKHTHTHKRERERERERKEKKRKNINNNKFSTQVIGGLAGAVGGAENETSNRSSPTPINENR